MIESSLFDFYGADVKFYTKEIHFQRYRKEDTKLETHGRKLYQGSEKIL